MRTDRKNPSKGLIRMASTLLMASLACGPVDLARDILGRLPTTTQASGVSEEHFSETWYVELDGDDANVCASPSTPCATIRRAAELADADDVIAIGPGTFSEDMTGVGGLNVLLRDEDLSLRGSGQEVTILDGLGEQAVLDIRDSTMTVRDLTVTGTGGLGYVFGIRAIRSTVLIEDVTVRDGDGLGIVIDDSQATIRRVLVTNNGQTGVTFGGDGLIEDSTISNNRGGGLSGGRTVEVRRLIIDGNQGPNGAGVHHDGGEMTIIDSAITRNQVTTETHSRALGVFNGGTLALINTTVSNNSVVSGGSGLAIYSLGELTLIHTTVADNRGGGVAGSPFGGITFENSLIANNDLMDCWIHAATHKTFVGFNVDSDETCVRWSNSDRTEHEVALGPLTDNGGSTETHALLPGNPGLDTATGDCPAADQRGASRPFGSACDVGAYEHNPIFGGVMTSLEVTGTPELTTVTPTPPPPTVNRDSLCWTGPGPGYLTIQSLAVGAQVSIVGRGVEGGWWIIDSPRYPGQSCWVPELNIDLPPNFDPNNLPAVNIPPLPTATPPPGCLYQGPNDNAPVCYPIAQCPVPFEQTLGACVP